jgi:hypothetical protein
MLAKLLMRSPLPSREFRSMMPTDLKELLRAFNDHAVKYLIVGGYAFGVHAEPRATKDLDMFIRSDEENSKAVFNVLAQYGAPLAGLGPRDFMDGTTFQIGQPPTRIDIVQNIVASLSTRHGKTGLRDLSMAKSRPPSYPETISSETSSQLDGNRISWTSRSCALYKTAA